MTVAEVVALTGLGKSTIYAGLCETHKLKRVVFQKSPTARKTIRFVLSDVQQWIAARSADAKPQRSKLQRITAQDRIIDLAQYKRSRQ